MASVHSLYLTSGLEDLKGVGNVLNVLRLPKNLVVHSYLELYAGDTGRLFWEIHIATFTKSVSPLVFLSVLGLLNFTQLNL